MDCHCRTSSSLFFSSSFTVAVQVTTALLFTLLSTKSVSPMFSQQQQQSIHSFLANNLPSSPPPISSAPSESVESANLQLNQYSLPPPPVPLSDSQLSRQPRRRRPSTYAGYEKEAYYASRRRRPTPSSRRPLPSKSYIEFGAPLIYDQVMDFDPFHTGEQMHNVESSYVPRHQHHLAAATAASGHPHPTHLQMNLANLHGLVPPSALMSSPPADWGILNDVQRHCTFAGSPCVQRSLPPQSPTPPHHSHPHHHHHPYSHYHHYSTNLLPYHSTPFPSLSMSSSYPGSYGYPMASTQYMPAHHHLPSTLSPAFRSHYMEHSTVPPLTPLPLPSPLSEMQPYASNRSISYLDHLPPSSEDPNEPDAEESKAIELEPLGRSLENVEKTNGAAATEVKGASSKPGATSATASGDDGASKIDTVYGKRRENGKVQEPSSNVEVQIPLSTNLPKPSKILLESRVIPLELQDSDTTRSSASSPLTVGSSGPIRRRIKNDKQLPLLRKLLTQKLTEKHQQQHQQHQQQQKADKKQYKGDAETQTSSTPAWTELLVKAFPPPMSEQNRKKVMTTAATRRGAQNNSKFAGEGVYSWNDMTLNNDITEKLKNGYDEWSPLAAIDQPSADLWRVNVSTPFQSDGDGGTGKSSRVRSTGNQDKPRNHHHHYSQNAFFEHSKEPTFSKVLPGSNNKVDSGSGQLWNSWQPANNNNWKDGSTGEPPAAVKTDHAIGGSKWRWPTERSKSSRWSAGGQWEETAETRPPVQHSRRPKDSDAEMVEGDPHQSKTELLDAITRFVALQKVTSSQSETNDTDMGDQEGKERREEEGEADLRVTLTTAHTDRPAAVAAAEVIDNRDKSFPVHWRPQLAPPNHQLDGATGKKRSQTPTLVPPISSSSNNNYNSPNKNDPVALFASPTSPSKGSTSWLTGYFGYWHFYGCGNQKP
ncbi:hypothetical protein TYRP_000053 [Tyrophagus putrescentiae]|nr:hypothetical protein TYRP_000053 [Tyrophagus putrescentiae]